MAEELKNQPEEPKEQKKPKEALDSEDEEIQEGEEEQESPKKKKWIFLSGVILVPLVAAALLVIFVLFPKYQVWSQTQPKEVEEKKEEKKKEEIGVIYKITDLTVNPKSSMGRHVAVFEIALEVSNQGEADNLKRYHPIIMDQFIGYFRTKTNLELSTETFLPIMKRDLIKIANDILQEDSVYELYFTRYIVE